MTGIDTGRKGRVREQQVQVQVQVQAGRCVVLSSLRSRAEQPWEPARLVASRIKRLAMENRADAVISTPHPETGSSRPSTKCPPKLA